MKILHVIDSLGYGGAERLLVDLVDGQTKRGFDVTVVSLSKTMPLEKEIIGAPVICLNFGGNIYSLIELYKAVRALRSILLRERIQILHSHLYASDIISRLAAPGRCVIVNTIHNRDPWWYQRTRVRSVFKKFLDALTHKWRNVTSIAVSIDAGREAANELRICSSNLRVIYNGIKVDGFDAKSAIRPIRIIIQVARLYPAKGHRTALEAFSMLHKDYPHLQLYWLGGGPEEENLRYQVKMLGLEESVRFLGFRDDVPDFLMNSDVFWMPSAWEGLPIACIEAMAASLPVVATKVGGIPELLLDGITGYLIDSGCPMQLAEATRLLIQDYKAAAAMGDQGRRRVINDFSIENTVDSYCMFYKELARDRLRSA